MDFQLFSSQHFKEYCSWFEDEELKRWLGPKPKTDWLEYILKDQTGQQYSVFENGKMLAVLGIIFPIDAHHFYVLTDIAVSPKSKGKGIGKTVVRHLLQLHSPSVFKTFVEAENFKAIAFFKHLGWIKSATIDKDGMYFFVYDVSNKSSTVS